MQIKSLKLKSLLFSWNINFMQIKVLQLKSLDILYFMIRFIKLNLASLMSRKFF